MLTLEKLDNYGADTKDGITRCVNNEALYLKFVNKFLEDNTFIKLKQSIDNNYLDEAFECAHSLKGVLANLSLTPLYSIIYEITELLRKRTNMDYSNLINQYEKNIMN